MFEDNEIIKKALAYATIKHNGQFRKGDKRTDYIYHPINVAKKVSNHFNFDENMICAALLHDTLEDTDTSYNELVTIFNKEIADLVLELTNDKEKIKMVGKTAYLSRKMVKMSENAFKIKLCDRLDNIEDTLTADESFRNKYQNDTINILEFILTNRDISHEELIIINQIISIIIKSKEKKLALNFS